MTVRREDFLPPPPWLIAQPFNTEQPYRETTNVAELYEDTVVAIDPKRQLNNGQPSAHKLWMDAVDPKPGERVLHVGCGTGYYTALLAERVGPTGSVVAREIDEGLAAWAKRALKPWPWVSVNEGGAPFDVVYVNAGCTHALPEWLETKRLLIPLTVHVPMFPQHGVGFVLLAERAEERWPARVVSPVGIFDCEGARGDETELMGVLQENDRIKALCLVPHPRGPECLAHRDGFCLQG
jgi:protein-L-isoaspartate(D-aspartate) O-methyltransferase